MDQYHGANMTDGQNAVTRAAAVLTSMRSWHQHDSDPTDRAGGQISARPRDPQRNIYIMLPVYNRGGEHLDDHGYYPGRPGIRRQADPDGPPPSWLLSDGITVDLIPQTGPVPTPAPRPGPNGTPPLCRESTVSPQSSPPTPRMAWAVPQIPRNRVPVPPIAGPAAAQSTGNDNSRQDGGPRSALSALRAYAGNLEATGRYVDGTPAADALRSLLSRLDGTNRRGVSHTATQSPGSGSTNGPGPVTGNANGALNARRESTGNLNARRESNHNMNARREPYDHAPAPVSSRSSAHNIGTCENIPPTHKRECLHILEPLHILNPLHILSPVHANSHLQAQLTMRTHADNVRRARELIDLLDSAEMSADDGITADVAPAAPVRRSRWLLPDLPGLPEDPARAPATVSLRQLVLVPRDPDHYAHVPAARREPVHPPRPAQSEQTPQQAQQPAQQPMMPPVQPPMMPMPSASHTQRMEDYMNITHRLNQELHDVGSPMSDKDALAKWVPQVRSGLDSLLSVASRY